MRIGIFDRNLNVCGGRELLTASIIDCLKRMQCEILLISSEKFDGSLLKRNFGLDVLVDNEILLPVEFPRLPYFMTVYWKLFVPSLLRNKCDIIVDAFSNLLSPFVGVTYFHGFWQIGNITPESDVKPKFLHPSQWPCFLIQKIIASNSKKLILANSNFTANGIQKLLGVRPTVIYPPVRTIALNSSSSGSKENIVLTISRFSHEKNLEILPKIAQKTYNAKFVVFGSVYDEETFAGYKKMITLVEQHGIKDKVKVLTNLSLSEKLSLLARSKVYLHTMKFEDFGISIAEGMMASCVPVVHNSGGPIEFVPKEWRYDDPEGASQKIEEALEKWSPKIGKELRTIASQFSEINFRQRFSTIFRNYLTSLNWQQFC
ncbi:MAG: glycosyltransferase [Candidatus Bathyarchaeia archaeon]